MALTEFQRDLCRLIARQRVDQGESYVAGGAALNEILKAPRISHDLDLFHDTDQALRETWDADRVLLRTHGYAVQVLRERPTFVEARLEKDGNHVVLQWVRDSAYRFFPLVAHDEFGLTLHPYDLATNKVLALVGRVEARDWIDVLECHEKIQRLGYLAWGACAKDAAFSPRSILELARRSCRYTTEEVGELVFEGGAPNVRQLMATWRAILEEGERIAQLLPEDHVGTCVLHADGSLWNEPPDTIEQATRSGTIRFHQGTIRGAYPRLADTEPG